MKISRAEFLKKAGLASLAAASVPALAHLSADEAHGQGNHVRWDIIHITPVPPAAGSVFTAGGEAFAFAYHTPGNPSAAH